MIVCICNNVSSSRIEELFHSGVTDPEKILSCLGIATLCGTCKEYALESIQKLSNVDELLQ